MNEGHPKPRWTGLSAKSLGHATYNRLRRWMVREPVKRHWTGLSYAALGAAEYRRRYRAMKENL